MGDILGRIHTAEIQNRYTENKIQLPPKYKWDEYLQQGKDSDAEWADKAEDVLHCLKRWNNDALKAQKELNKNTVISHRDLDPKNVLWEDLNPYIIDWEAAGYINPYIELLEMLNYWCTDGKNGINKGLFDSMIAAYKKQNNCNDVDWDMVIAGAYKSMLGWLDYSFKRALGRETEDENEKVIGAEQAVQTINELKNYEQKAILMKEWLL